MKKEDDLLAAAVRDELVRRKGTIEEIGRNELAEACGVSRSQLSTWLAGKRAVTTVTASRVLAALGLEIRR